MRRAFILKDGTQRWIVTKWLGGLMGLSAIGCLGSVPLVAQDKVLGVSGVEKENFSKTLKASDDFFRFVNENWLETTDIPPDQSNFGAFTALDIETKAAIRAIIEQASGSSDASAEAKQVGNLFKSRPLNTSYASRESRGTESGWSRYNKKKNSEKYG